MLGSISIASPPATPLFARSTVRNDVEAEMRSATWPSTLPSSPAATADQLASAQPTAAQVAAPDIQEAMLAGYGTSKRTNPAILARAEPPKKSKTADLSDVQREVESALARVPSFSVLPSASRARILSNMTPEGRCDAQLADRVAGTLQVLAPVRTEHARSYRLAVGSSLLNPMIQCAGDPVSQTALGKRVGLHSTTIKRINDAFNTFSDSTQVASIFMAIQRQARRDRINFDGSAMKRLCLHFLICTTRDSPNPDDVVVLRFRDQKTYVSCRYMNVKKGEAYFNFMRDLCRLFEQQHPSEDLAQHRFVSYSIFLAWLREWKFIKTEEWHVCVCALCFNVEQFVKAYNKLTRCVHGSPHNHAATTTVPLLSQRPSSKNNVVDFLDAEACDSDDDDDFLPSAFISADVECKRASCMAAPCRKSAAVELPFNGAYHTYVTCFLIFSL